MKIFKTLLIGIFIIIFIICFLSVLIYRITHFDIFGYQTLKHVYPVLFMMLGVGMFALILLPKK